MKTALDTHYWKELLTIPTRERCAWIGPDAHDWSIAELRGLGAPPPGISLYIWKFEFSDNVRAHLKSRRSFHDTDHIWSNIVHSDNATFQNRSLWFDLASIDGTCAEDILNYLIWGQMNGSAGLIVETDNTSQEELGARISSTILQTWIQQSTQERPHEWTDEAWQQINEILPGFMYYAHDMNARRYFMTLAESVFPWLVSRSVGKLDPGALYALGIDFRAPHYPVPLRPPSALI